MLWEYITGPFYRPKRILIFSIVFVVMLFFILPVFPNWRGILISLVITSIVFPILMYLQRKDDREQEEYYQAEYQRQKDEYDEYMRIERMKMQDTGTCVNCNTLLDPDLPYCPNCKFRIEDYA